jgi:DNA-binding beta-propeller fold protein YncE
MTRTILSVAILLAALALLAAASGAHGNGDEAGYEVWVVDQSNTTRTASGGAIYVYPGRALEGRSAATAVPERIDLGGPAQALCLARTGAAPVRPHMLLFNAEHTHAALAFVASGHVVFFDAATRTPVACLRMSIGAGGARQAHAAFPSPDGRYAIVANQNGKLLQRISTDYEAGTFTLDEAATLDLATCTTPSGAPCQAPGLRPDTAPICPIVDSSGRYSFVTLRGGGLLVVDIRSTPMRIVAEYDQATVHGNGCGGAETRGKMYIDSGGGTAMNLSEFDVYAFRLSAFSTAPTPPNTPAPTLVVSQDEREHADAHGVALTKHGRYLWVADRAGNRVVVIRTATDEVVGEFSVAGPLSDDPSPDLLDTSPNGNRVFVSLRGRLPLSGDPHASTGSTPGVGVIGVQRGGRRGELRAIARISNADASGIDRADPHGLRVRLTAPAGHEHDDDE